MNVRRFAEETTLHGIRDCISADSKLLRAFWIVIIAFSCAITAYELYGVITQYINQPRTITTQFGQFTEGDVFPLAFCPDKWIDSVEMFRRNMSPSTLTQLTSMFPRFAGIMALIDPYGTIFRSNLSSENNLPDKVADIVRLISDISVNASAMTCPTCLSDYPRKVVTHHGVCFLLRFPYYSSINYSFTGYEVTFVYTQPPAATTMLDIYSDKLGILLYGEDVLDILPNDELSVVQNAVLTVKLRVSYLQMLPTNTPCSDAPDSRKARAKCRTNCIQQTLQKFVNCTMAFTEINPTDQGLTADACNARMYSIYGTAQNPAIQTNFAMCFASCYGSCTRMDVQSTCTYDRTRPSGAVISPVMLKIQNAGEVVQLVEVPSQSWDTLLSNIGGQLGLWLGASLMSLLQLGYFFALWCQRPRLNLDSLTAQSSSNLTTEIRSVKP